MATKKKETPYLERDISWMYFNRRILQEAARPEVPLLERMTFLGIYSNNLDEFFRVRMASQSRIAECADRAAAGEREKAHKVLKQIAQLQRSVAILFCMSISCVLRSFSWVLQIFIGRRIGGLNVITPEGLGVVTEGTV